MNKKYMALDTETSGFKPGQICQLSYIIFDEDFKILKTFNQYFVVESVDEGASNVHGLTVEKLEKLSNGKIFKDIFAEFLSDIIEMDRIFIHNSPFDIGFINAELSRLGIAFDFAKAFCTMRYHVNICKLPGKGRDGEDYKWPKLSEVLEHYNIQDVTVKSCEEIYQCEEISFHDARFDVVSLYEICKCMKLNS